MTAEQSGTKTNQEPKAGRNAGEGAAGAGFWQRLKFKLQYLRLNWRVYAAAAVLFGAFYVYSAFFKPPAEPTLFDLNLPVMIDAYTDLTAVEEQDNEVVLTFIRRPEAFGDVSVSERDQILDQIVKNAPALCRNQQFYQIIASGKKLTVLLQGSDGSFERRYSLTQCPLPQAAQ